MGIVLICIVLVHFALARLSGWLCTCPAAYTGTAELEFGLDLACAQLAQQSWRRMRIRPAAFLLVFRAALGLMLADVMQKNFLKFQMPKNVFWGPVTFLHVLYVQKFIDLFTIFSIFYKFALIRDKS